jgi:hypothetical protein
MREKIRKRDKIQDWRRISAVPIYADIFGNLRS